MAAFLTASLVFLLVFSVSVSADQRIITAEPGENVILTCRAAENKEVRVVEWNRTDPESNQRVLLYKDKKLNPEAQSPSFRNRVDLLDVEKRDVSLVLKNVTTDDTGRYECRVVQRGNNEFMFICTINLRVEAGNEEDGGNKTGLIVGILVGLLALVLLVGFLLYVCRVRNRTRFLQQSNMFL